MYLDETGSYVASVESFTHRQFQPYKIMLIESAIKSINRQISAYSMVLNQP